MFVLGSFAKNVNLFHRKDVWTDNIIFRLHYRMTFPFVLLCCVLVSSRQFISEHINCIADKAVMPVINTFCFFSATFTVKKYHNQSYVAGTHIAHPGVGPHTDEDEVSHHAYYQWVPFVLFFQALLFYVPHWLWKGFDNGRLSAIVNNVKTLPFSAEHDVSINGQKIDSDETKRKRETFLRDVYLTRARFRINRDWAFYLVLCELLNMVNIIVQVYMLDWFLKGQFSSLGAEWLASTDDYILDTVFPKVSKCTFHKYGPSGSIQNHDTMCVMALNIINEKIYVALWFWFYFLFFWTFVGLVWRIMTLVLHRRSAAFNRFVWSMASPGPALKRKEIEIITTKLNFSDWLFLYYLGKNMDGRMFRRTVTELTLSLGTPLLSLQSDSEKSNLANESYC